MPASTNKSILITPGSYSSLATSVSQIDLKWYESGIGTFVFVPNSGDLRSTIYNWQQNSEPVILFGGIGTYNSQRKFVGPYQDFSGSFTGITSFPYIQFYPLSGTINANTINVTGVASFTQIYVNGLSTIGSLYLPGPLYDNSFSPGTLGQLLQSTGSGIAWTSVNTTGIITASGGIPNRVTKFLDEDTIGNSTITDTGTAVSIGVGLTVNGAVTSFGFYGPSTFITNLNASNLASGTVPSGRVTGSYSGITSVGNLDLLYVIGVATASAFFGNGANLSNLNASNLTSGTVPSARVTGNYSGITSVGTLSQLIVSGFSTVNTIRISGSLYDSNFSPGLNNQFLISTGAGIAWTTVSATGILTGSGTLNTVAKFGSPNSLVDSKITDTGSVVTIGVGLSVSGFSSSFGFYGPGTFITNLSASNLASGTVPSDRVVGSYSGITSVGTLTQLITIGFATASGFFGPGTFITNLNASNLVSGTVPSAVVTGSYSGITSVGTLTQLITSGFATASGFFGPGTFITNLSASNLASGTVPSDRVVGSYSGITSVGTLTQLITIGFATASGFFGPGTFITNLNASNLASGTVPSAVVTGSYSGITSVGSLSQLVVTGFSTINSIKINGSLYDASFNPGSAGQYLISTGSGIAWTTISATGILTGSGTQNTIAKFGSSNSLTNSNITDTGSVVSIGVGLSVFGFSSSAGFYGPGTFITNLNASSLASGTVPSDRVIGNYSGITSVGTLTQLITSGFATASGFFGPGTFITNLNASNLASGTIPSGRVTGNYSGITSVGTLTQLIVSGFSTINNIRISGALYDSSFTPGSVNQVLISTGAGISWTTATSTGILTGSGTINTVPKFNTANSLTNSNITDSGTQIVLGSASSISGILTSFGYFGPGTNITNLNASNLASGTVPSAVVSGSYSGITSVGTLTQLITSGFATATGFFGPGTFITNLNASNLASGTVPSAVVSGTYSGITSVGTLTQLITSGFATASGFFGPGTFITNLNASNLASGTVPSAVVSGSYSGITSVGTLSQLIVSGFSTINNIRISGALYDGSLSPGTANQVLISTGTGIAWTTSTSTGILTGSGTINTVPKFNTANSLTNSNITDNGIAVTVNSRLNVVGVGSFTNDLIVNQITVGQGGGQNPTNTVLGLSVLSVNTTGTQNTIIGYQAGIANTSGSSNVFIGHQAAQANNAGGNNIAIGSLALVSNVSGANNVAHGSEALRYYTATSNQTAIGYQALRGNSTTSLNTGDTNTAVGYQAGLANTSGSGNTFVGYLVGRANTTGQQNTFVGNAAGYRHTTGSYNNVFGSSALSAINTGNSNQVFGYLALFVNTSGGNNHAFGNNSLESNTTASNNVAFGNQTLTRVATNGNNVAVGFAAMRYTTAANQVAVGYQALTGSATTELNTGTQNTAIGYQAGLANSSGSSNVFVGFQAGLANTSGGNNTFVGNISGSKNTTGIENTGLGNGTLRDNTSGQDNTAIGNAVLVANTTGSYNNALGVFAMLTNTTGGQNQAFGYLALTNNTSGGGNLAFGHASLQNNTTANTNIAFGHQTLTRVTTNGNNTAVGSEALRYATVSNQVAVGYQALTGSATTQLNSGTQNTALGYQAGTANTSGSDNLFVGFQAGAANTTGSSNAFIGGSSGASNTSGDRNASLGHQALQSNTINGQNVAVGQAALRYFDQPNQTAVGWQALQGSSTVALNTGVQNVALGYQAGLANTSGSNNSYLGFRAGTANTSGNSNIFVGTNAGASIVSGSNNIIIGTFADGAIGSQYQIAIGISVTPTGSNMGAWGRNSDSLRTDLGIGTYTPLSRLHVETLAAGNMGLYIAGAASQTADLVEVNATTVGQNYFTITGIGSVGIYTNRPSQALDINGGTRLRGRLFDNSNSAGSANQVLISTGSGISWTSATATGIVTGTGAATRIAYFADPNTLTSNSNFIIDSFGQFGISTDIPRQKFDVFATARFSGPALFYGSTSNDAFALLQTFDTIYQGTNNVLRFRQGGSTAGAVAFSFYDDLPAIFMTYNAANSPRVGIGTTGPLQTLHVGGNALISGFTTSSGYFGPGTNLTNLNASNLASGTAPSAVVSGSYSGITSVGTQSQLIVSGFSTLSNVIITGALYDGSFSPGTINQILISTGAGVSWTSATATGIVTGSGSASQVTYWAGTSRVTGNNLFVYNGIGSVGIGTNIPEYALHVVGTMAATIKSFIIDHPTQSGRKLRYASLEGPENGVYVRGRSSDPIIILPNYWTGLVDEDTITVNITPVGKYQNIYVEKIVDYVVYVKCNSMLCTHLDYFYTVYGERKDVSKLEVEI